MYNTVSKTHSCRYNVSTWRNLHTCLLYLQSSGPEELTHVLTLFVVQWSRGTYTRVYSICSLEARVFTYLEVYTHKRAYFVQHRACLLHVVSGGDLLFTQCLEGLIRVLTSHSVYLLMWYILTCVLFYFMYMQCLKGLTRVLTSCSLEGLTRVLISCSVWRDLHACLLHVVSGGQGIQAG